MKVKLGDVCEINPKVDKLPNDTQVSFIPMQNVTDDGKVDSSTIRTVEEVKKVLPVFEKMMFFLQKSRLAWKMEKEELREISKTVLASEARNFMSFGLQVR